MQTVVPISAGGRAGSPVRAVWPVDGAASRGEAASHPEVMEEPGEFLLPDFTGRSPRAARNLPPGPPVRHQKGTGKSTHSPECPAPCSGL